MRISYEWLGDFVQLGDVTPKDAAEVLTRLGIEVESLTLVDLSQMIVRPRQRSDRFRLLPEFVRHRPKHPGRSHIVAHVFRNHAK